MTGNFRRLPAALRRCATERGRPHDYRVQGPEFLIEYAASQDDGNLVSRAYSIVIASSAITFCTAGRARTRCTSAL
jgi:hypothetical protein